MMHRTGAEGSAVGGVNPTKITCDDLFVRNRFTFHGAMMSRIVALNGDAADTGIRFANGGAGSGFYSPAPDRIGVAIGGAPVAYFAPDGLGATNIFSPTGTIDFGGATLTGIGGITANPRAYEVVGEHVATAGLAPATILSIPVQPTAGMSGAWEFVAKVIYILAGSGGAISGAYSARIRAWRSGEAMPGISARYDETQYEDAGLIGCAIDFVSAAGAVNIRATGIDGESVVWQAKVSAVKVEIMGA